MLTTTYAFLSLSMDQKRLHVLLSTAQHLLQINSERQLLDVAHLKPVIRQFARLAASCRKRKIEVYVIPAIQNATHQADGRLSEMESSKVIGRKILGSVKAWARMASDEKDTAALYLSIESCCNHLLERLVMEEQELLPLAQRVIPNDQWFAMGAQFLKTDTTRKMRRTSDRVEIAPSGGRGALQSKSLLNPLIDPLTDPLISLAFSGYTYSN